MYSRGFLLGGEAGSTGPDCGLPGGIRLVLDPDCCIPAERPLFLDDDGIPGGFKLVSSMMTEYLTWRNQACHEVWTSSYSYLHLLAAGWS
jgi:hypothetical protein